MERGNHKTEGVPLTPLTSGSLLAFSSLNPESTVDSQHIGSANLLHLAMERLSNFATASTNTDNPQSTEQTYNFPFRTEASTTDVQNLTQHLLTLANSVSSGSTPSQSVLCANPTSCTETENKWKRYPQSRIPPTALTSVLSNDRTGPVHISQSSILNADSANPLNQLASLSQAWSTSSPTAMATFQNALAQLALLGLSSPPPPPPLPSNSNREIHEIAMGENTIGNVGNTHIATANVNAFKSKDNNAALNGNKLFQRPTESPSSDIDSVSRVIVRQTADADEHFFKALRKLKVDVLPELQSSELKPMPALLKSLCKTPPESDQTPHGLRVPDRTAAELAVDEHFEKSLAGFRRFSVLKSSQVEPASMKSKPLNEAASGIHVTDAHANNTTRSSINESCETRCNRPKFLVRQRSEFEVPFPCDSRNVNHAVESTTLASTQSIVSPSGTLGDSSANTHVDLSKPTMQAGKVRGSGVRPQEVEVLHLVTTSPTDSPRPLQQHSIVSTITPTTGMASQNSFKPKKNWLAQYDWRHNPAEPVGTSPPSPNTAFSFSFDSPTSSQLSNSLSKTASMDDRSRGSAFNTFGMQRCQGQTERQNEDQTDRLTQSDECGTGSLITSATTTASAAKVTGQMEVMEDVLTDRFSSHEAGEFGGLRFIYEGDTVETFNSKSDQMEDSPTHLPCGMLTTRSTGRSTRKTGNFGDGGTVTYKTTATSPFSSDLDGFAKNLTCTDTQCELRDCKRFMEQCTNSESTKTSNGISKALLPRCRSNSSSPSPTPCDGSLILAITPVSGATSGFFSGSTYSLDSSIGQTQLSSFETRELDAGIDMKSTMNEQSISSSKAQSPVENALGLNSGESSACLWSLRKRASTEASPWSTLKRSRSVVTSPLACTATHPSCSPSSHELLRSTEDEAVLSEKGFVIDSQLTDEIGRPLTPDMSQCSTTKTMTYAHKTSQLQMKNDQLLKSLDSNLPRFYHICRDPCDHKSNSEPSTLRNSPGAVNINRSFSDASALPSGLLRLKHDGTLFVLR